MSNPPGSGPPDVLLRLTVPSTGELRSIAPGVAVKVAEYLGTSGSDAESLAAALERAAAAIGEVDEDQIEFVFRKAGADLLIEARAGGRASEVRHPLPA